jgi:hypothetical protein
MAGQMDDLGYPIGGNIILMGRRRGRVCASGVPNCYLSRCCRDFLNEIDHRIQYSPAGQLENNHLNIERNFSIRPLAQRTHRMQLFVLLRTVLYSGSLCWGKEIDYLRRPGPGHYCILCPSSTHVSESKVGSRSERNGPQPLPSISAHHRLPNLDT